MRHFPFIVALLTLSAIPAFGQATYSAASCSLANVQSAYTTEQASKADGDIISIPTCGATTWGSAWSITPTNSLTIQGQSTTTGTCAPQGTCTATDNTNIPLSSTFSAATATGKSFRLTGISFTNTGSAKYGALNFTGSSTAVRIDHNHFTDNDGGGHTLQIDGVRGVVDHNYFQMAASNTIFAMQVTNIGSDGMADTIWTQVESFGSSDFVYVENNFFVGDSNDFKFAYDCDSGGKIALRYNSTGTGSPLQSHGTGSGGSIRGCRATETYENTFNYGGATPFFALLDYEGGPSMFWGNTISNYDTIIREQEVRVNTATYTQIAPPNGWGYCGTTNGPSNWDRNSNSNGYACLDQVGRGAGDLLQGGFSSDGFGSNNKCDSATTNCTNHIYTGSWPNQALIPTYAWQNTHNADGDTLHYWVNLNAIDPVTENQDYYLQLPNENEGTSFNGTAGIGNGSSAPGTAFPTCTTNASSDAIAAGTTWLGVSVSGHWGPGYWDTTNNTLYVCTATNTWTAYYSPYTYPHPLEGTSPPAPAAVMLAISVH